MTEMMSVKTVAGSALPRPPTHEKNAGEALCWCDFSGKRNTRNKTPATIQNMERTRSTPSARTSISFGVLYRANEARTMPSTP